MSSLRHAVDYHRTKTWEFQDRAGVSRTRTVYAERRTWSVAFLRWDARLWLSRQTTAARLVARAAPTGGSVQSIICGVFGVAQCQEALYIAKRESGYSTNPQPPNPTHFGIFQLDASALHSYATIGYSTAYQQVVAAHNMFLARGWEPWTCCEG